MKKHNLFNNKSIVTAVLCTIAMIFTSCISTGADDGDVAITRGIDVWNNRDPEAARAYWNDIVDPAAQKKYLGYIDAYYAGVEALDSTDTLKSEAKLLSACKTALTKFESLDPLLQLGDDVCDKGATVTAERVTKLLESGNTADAKKLLQRAIKVYGQNDQLAYAQKVCDTVTKLASKKSELKAKIDEVEAIEDVDKRILAYNDLTKDIPSMEAAFNAEVSKSGIKAAAITNMQKSYKKMVQDANVNRESAIREKAYTYKEMIGEVFARQPEGEGSGKKGTFTNEDILSHYKSVQKDMDKVFAELLDFKSQYPNVIGQDVIDDINAQKNDLNSKISQVTAEIAREKEIASRGKTCMPLMIGLFNPAAGSTGNNKKSRPAKFSATGQKGNEYWWGMVSIPKGEMNDLVITMKDNRTVRVFNENTKSGKLIEKNNLQNLVSMQNKVGNSWPVMNAGAQLKGTNYYFEVQKGKTDSYEGEVVVYSSFITRSR